MNVVTKINRDIRRCALQSLYQLDAARHEPPTAEELYESLDSMPGGDRARRLGVELAFAAQEMIAHADAEFAALTPDWPTYRQPMIDRNVLRLCYYEMLSRRTPPKVAINEAIELAREFSTEKSPLFVNGVLDRILRHHPELLQPTGLADTDIDDIGDADADGADTDAEPSIPPLDPAPSTDPQEHI